MKFFYLSLVASLFCGHIAAFPAQGAGVHNLHRSTETCGDPSVATTFFEGFKPSVDSHALDTMDNFITLEAGADVWNIDGPSFRAWISASQANTTPLYWLYNSKTHDYGLPHFSNGGPSHSQWI
ncbi:hypothetical protein CPB84DRAFT_1853966 [Gymnopilus junonius]|uniref:Uncharacterized protein n=1 Tax=Gymnopilus junonius TaxID=109634 RepID=A0A9P5N9W7_GYMJU|nr:hypothetical protein CPB84DRAFT_1853966 [Gymnopilus junonius]